LRWRVNDGRQQVRLTLSVWRVAFTAMEIGRLCTEMGSNQKRVAVIMTGLTKQLGSLAEKMPLLSSMGTMTGQTILCGRGVTRGCLGSLNHVGVTPAANIGTTGLHQGWVLAEVWIVTVEAAGAPSLGVERRMLAPRGFAGRHVSVASLAQGVVSSSQSDTAGEGRSMASLTASLGKRCVCKATHQHAWVVGAMSIVARTAVSSGEQLSIMNLVEIRRVVAHCADLGRGASQKVFCLCSVWVVAVETGITRRDMGRRQLKVCGPIQVRVAHET